MLYKCGLCDYEFERELRKCPRCGNSYEGFYDDELGEPMFMTPIYRKFTIDFSLIKGDKNKIFEEIKRSWLYIEAQYSGVLLHQLDNTFTAPDQLVLESYHVGYARVLKILQDVDSVEALTYEDIPPPNWQKKR